MRERWGEKYFKSSQTVKLSLTARRCGGAALSRARSKGPAVLVSMHWLVSPVSHWKLYGGVPPLGAAQNVTEPPEQFVILGGLTTQLRLQGTHRTTA